MVMISRITVNYAVIAVAFLLLGIVMGAIGYQRFDQSNSKVNEALINAAVSRSITAMQDAVDKSVASAVTAAGGSQQAAAGPDPNKRYTIPVDNHPAMGPADAPVTIVEFSDFRCAFCGKFARETLNPLMAKYDGKVKFVYRNFIIFGQTSYDTAMAAYCAGDQGKFWDFHNLAFSDQQNLGRDDFVKFATNLKLDVKTFTGCLDNSDHRQQILDDMTYADSLGLQGTPSFFVNGKFVSGAQPIDVWSSVIDGELATIANGGQPAAESTVAVSQG
jgi:protein-disulfide isomerase